MRRSTITDDDYGTRWGACAFPSSVIVARNRRPSGSGKASQTRNRGSALLLCLIPLLLLAGCGKNEKTAAASPPEAPRVEDMSRDPLKLTLTIEPGKVHLDRDILLTVRVEAPSEIDVTLPSLDDRVQGFIVAGSFNRGPFVNRGIVTTERHVRLTPVLSDTYRIAPFAVTYRDGGVSPARKSWFATRPIRLEAVPPIAGDPGSSISAGLAPVWVYPPFRTVALWAICGLAGLALLFLAWKLLKRVHRHIRLMRMSPRERALEELTELLAKDLVGRHLVKEFYLELTMIVRRYIERAHAVRAPEQTTEEFLAAVSVDARFGAEVVRKLRGFLQAADLVKFAAHHPGAEAVDTATRTARQYIETDAAEPAAQEEP